MDAQLSYLQEKYAQTLTILRKQPWLRDHDVPCISEVKHVDKYIEMYFDFHGSKNVVIQLKPQRLLTFKPLREQIFLQMRLLLAPPKQGEWTNVAEAIVELAHLAASI